MEDLLRESLRRRLRKFVLSSLEIGKVPKPPLKDEEACFLAVLAFQQPLDERSLAKLFCAPKRYLARIGASLKARGFCQRGRGTWTITPNGEVVLEVFARVRFPESEEVLRRLSQYPQVHELGQIYSEVVDGLLAEKIKERLAERVPRAKRPPTLEDFLDVAAARCALAEDKRTPYEVVHQELKLA